MNTYFIHDGRNESGPFTIDELSEKRLNRNTAIRLKDTDQWMPAEKLPALKEKLAPRRIRRPKDIVPVMAERLTDMHYRQPRTLYGILLGTALFGSFSIYSVTKTEAQPVTKAAATGLVPIDEPVKQEPAIQKPQVDSLQIVAVKPKEVKPVEIAKPKKEAVIKEDKEKAARKMWSKLITATNSNYGIGLLGGIKDLSVIVNNRSEYPLDEVVAKVTYIKSNGSIWKTELVNINDVPENDTKEQPLEDVGRSKKVKVTLYKVVSKKMQFSYTEGQKVQNIEDPYYKQ